jgi:hypothetical protein
MNQVYQLPSEIIYHIFFFLPCSDINKFERVSKKWRKFFTNSNEKKKKLIQKDIWEIISSEQFPHQLKNRLKYPSKMDTKRFCVYEFRKYLVAETNLLERILRSLEFEFEKEKLFDDVCVFFPHLFHQYIQVLTI